jgi:DNA-binding CsgD family transcriptional regulator
MITYIYTLSDPITNQIKYVGKTNNLKQRLANHISDGRINKKNNLLTNWIKSLLNQNLKPKIEIIDETVENWGDLEQYWISQLKTWGFTLKNITLGGEGTYGRIWSQISINKIRDTRLAKIKSGEIIPTKHSEEWKEILRNKYSINDPIIKKLFKENKATKEIAEELGVTTKTICSRLKKINLTYKYNIDNRIIHEMIESGFNYSQIAKKLNVSTSTISRKYRNSEFYTGKRSKWDYT